MNFLSVEFAWRISTKGCGELQAKLCKIRETYSPALRSTSTVSPPYIQADHKEENQYSTHPLFQPKR